MVPCASKPGSIRGVPKSSGALPQPGDAAGRGNCIPRSQMSGNAVRCVRHPAQQQSEIAAIRRWRRPSQTHISGAFPGMCVFLCPNRIRHSARSPVWGWPESFKFRRSRKWDLQHAGRHTNAPAFHAVHPAHRCKRTREPAARRGKCAGSGTPPCRRQTRETAETSQMIPNRAASPTGDDNHPQPFVHKIIHNPCGLCEQL